MKRLSLDELRALSDAELRKYVAEVSEALRELRFRVLGLEENNPHQLRVLRRSVAQAKTLLREREITASLEAQMSNEASASSSAS